MEDGAFQRAIAHHHVHEQKVPRGALIGAAVVIVIAISLAAMGRANRVEAPLPTVAQSVSLQFADLPNGGVAVRSADGSREIMTLEPESGGFVRGVLRGMFRTRKLESIGREAPFLLGRSDDGRFVLQDPETGHSVELRSFGQTNYESFNRLMQEANR
ncbi:MAG: photosynthetic complex assembly protein PuhC [Myxococcota bacterium]